MPRFVTKESIDEVSSRIDIVSLVGEYVELEQRGRDWWGCCPFHNEKTPSFSVSPDKKFYHCFGCKASGTAFNFIMNMEKVSYGESIEILAKKTGVALKYESSGSDVQREDPNAKLKDEIIQLYNRVSGSFHYMLMETQAGRFALDYITKRGLTRETLEKFKIGYSPQDRLWLKKFLRSKNYSDEFLSQTGLFSTNYPDYAFFSDRLMFSIFDRKGDVVAFGGRFLRGDASKSPKYLNSRELVHYKKGAILYAFNFAKESIRQQKKVIFCEGYMDCVAYHQCGITWAVAPLGTALTEEQIFLVKPFVDEIYLSFDSDGAGQAATRRAIYMCRKFDIPVKIVQIQGGKDPAEIMLKFGPEYLTNEVNKAIIDMDFLLSKLLLLYPKEISENKIRAALDFFEYIDFLKSDIQKEECFDKFCQAFGVEKEAVRRDYLNRGQISMRFKSTGTEKKESAEQQSVVINAELRAVMTAVNEDSGLFMKMREEITANDLENEYSRMLFTAMEECLQNNSFSVGNILNRIENDRFRELVIQSVNEYSDNLKESVSGSISHLRKKVLKKKQMELLNRIYELEKNPDEHAREELTEAMRQKMSVDFKLKDEGIING